MDELLTNLFLKLKPTNLSIFDFTSISSDGGQSHGCKVESVARAISNFNTDAVHAENEVIP